MAELVVYGYHGPGEQRTAETLAAALPEHWVIVAGRSLPTPQQDDVDLLVIADNRIFVLEEKSWGPTVIVRNGGWQVKGSMRESPVGRNAHVARVLAGVLRQNVPLYMSSTAGQKLVVPRVILSHPELQLDTSRYTHDDEHILELAYAAEDLIAHDKQPSSLSGVRQAVIDFLSGLSARKELPTTLGHYTVASEAEPVGRSRVFVGSDSDGDPIVLRAYPMDGWGPGVDVPNLVRHERRATAQVAEIERSWSVESSFEDEARRWIILPIRPKASVSLSRHATAGNIVARDDAGLTGRAAAIILDAFTALSEVHEKGVTHRGLMPSRVLLGRRDRVLFRDFYLAHADSEATIASDIADTVDSSVPFRAPEVQVIVGNAVPESDVYSLALTILWWLNGCGSLNDGSDVLQIALSTEDFSPVIPILKNCLAANSPDRPSASRVVELLQELTPSESRPAELPVGDSSPAADQFKVGGLVEGRYEIQRVLGRGGFATSWLAVDNRTQGTRVIKQYSNPQARAAVLQEFESAKRLSSPRCARVWDCSPPNSPVYLVSEFVDGQSLRDFSRTGTADEEAYRSIALDALAGLEYMHSEEHLHRDVTPTNIIVRPDQSAVLIDFGLASAVSDAVSIAGTPPYMAPEVDRSGTWSRAADLYSLGVSLLYSMLGRYPYKTSESRRAEKDQIEPLTAEELETWGPQGTAVLRCLYRLVEPDEKDRPVSAAEFAEQLRMASAPREEAGKSLVNPTVMDLRRLYRGSSAGNGGNRGLDDDFARTTYVKTKLDTELAPSVLAGELDVVLLTGNPGDGKTSFLATLREELSRAGAVDTQPTTAAGWRMTLDGRTFASLYDASEARDGKTSDDLMHEALAGNGKHTALIAINDGRLLNFFRDYSDIYEEYHAAVEEYAAHKPVTHPRVAVVDLKRRTLAPTPGTRGGLAGAVLDSFTSDNLWATCSGCSARAVCPILSNRTLLRENGREPLLELVTVSHLRRKRRATFRDVRSAMAWTITGDRGCADVHTSIEAGRDLRMAENSLAHDLAFVSESPDYLVAEWALLDPQAQTAPRVDRAQREGRLKLPAFVRQGSAHRQLFFDGSGRNGVARSEVRAYRYFDEFIAALHEDTDPEATRAQVLLGLSRILGAPGYSGSGLALRDGESHGWSVLREIDRPAFELRPLPVLERFVEQQADALRLEHPLASLTLSLDSYELVRRASDGEILGDAGAKAVTLELSAFGDALRATPGRRVQVIDPAGRPNAVRVEHGVIRRGGEFA
ncbi:hypothetical protein FHE66_14620 [Georgenia sp. 311]|uniref:protein kinase domain-containing protein n=1 Tax=Georgenia sp. 311 TaxID=2585134 RepID=UPI001112B1E5|nr:protein kinase [Georgenia sp. 311]TNC16607.1 hypothetical protein FHE66_14620 [Georgenia sp. 311]